MEAEAVLPSSWVVNVEVLGPSSGTPDQSQLGSQLSGQSQWQPQSEVRARRSFVSPQQVTIGRSLTADIPFGPDEKCISSSHVVLERTASGYLLRDAGSRNGVYLGSGADSQQILELPISTIDPEVEIMLGPGGPRCRISVREAIPFADYLVTGQLGEGGMATVFVAQETIGLNRLVVLKLIAPSLLSALDPGEAEKMLATEASITSNINHQNVINIHRAGCVDGTPYIAMEYLRGVNLGSILKQLRQLKQRCPYDVAAALISQACWGLHAAHEAQDASGRSLGIVHRDFTPSNIVCSPQGNVKLIDFGVARALGRQYRSTSGFVGKPAYASPEQISQPKELDCRSDLFAAGVILYELCTGEPLFWRDNEYATMAAVMNEPIPPPRGLPPAMSSLLLRVLSRQPDQRPATAALLAEELEQIALAAGGQHLQRRAIPQTLSKLGVSLQPVLPEPLRGRPAVFPSSRAEQRYRSGPPPAPRPPAPGPALPVSHSAPVAVAASAAIPLAARPTQHSVRSLPAVPPSLAPPLLVPQRVELGGQLFQTTRSLASSTRSLPVPYLQRTFLATAHQPTGIDAAAATGELLLHLIGGIEPSDSPPPPAIAAQLRAFAARWQSIPAVRSPLVPLLAAGDSASGPYVLIAAPPPLLQSWQSLLKSSELTTGQRLAWGRQLVRCLVAAGELLTGLGGDFVHGALTPTAIFCSMAEQRTAIGMPAQLDWLLGTSLPAAAAPPTLILSDVQYLAPECAAGGPATPASDVYSVAALIYELMGGDPAAAQLAVRDGGRLPPLPPAVASEAAAEALSLAMQADPERRPRASELLRLLEDPAPAKPTSGPLALTVPAPGQLVTAAAPGGRRVYLQTVLLDRHGTRGPLPLPFSAVPHLLPAAVGLTLFRDSLAVELLDRREPGVPRPRLYAEHDPGGTARLFLSRERGFFEVGSRNQNWLQRIDYQSLAGGSGPAEVALPWFRLRLTQSGSAALLWTREPSSGDVHLCCIQLLHV